LLSEKPIKNEKFQLGVGPVDNNAKRIPWSKHYQLKLDDFQGKSNDVTKHEAQMAISIQPEYSVRFHGNKIKTYEITNMRVRANFQPTHAWINPSFWPEENTESALKFYQGSFDLAEELARKAQINAENKLYGRRFVCRGKSEQERKESSLVEAKSKIFEVIKPSLIEFAKEQLKYEKELNSPEKFQQNYPKYQKRFDDLRTEIKT